MMVDHDHIGRLSCAPSLDNEAFVPIGAFLAEAIVAGRSRERPDRIIVSDINAFGAIPRARQARKSIDSAQIGDVSCAREPPVRQMTPQVMLAHIVGPALQKGALHIESKRLDNLW
jgi:hypothetical protein